MDMCEVQRSEGKRVAHPSKSERDRGIGQAQLVQEDPATVRVRIVPDDEFGDATIEAFCAQAREIMGDGISFRFELCDRIERESSGKYRFCISRVAGNRFSADAHSRDGRTDDRSPSGRERPAGNSVEADGEEGDDGDR